MREEDWNNKSTVPRGKSVTHRVNRSDAICENKPDKESEALEYFGLYTTVVTLHSQINCLILNLQ